MASLLPTKISKIGDNARVNVSSLIRDMKVSKADVTSLVSTMSSYSASSYFVAEKVPALSVLDREVFVDLFRDSFLRMRELFRKSNSAGLVINSMIDIYTSDIEKMERDIEDLNMFVDNYEFLSGKDDYFNFNYIEKFDNSLNSMFNENYVFTVPDRNGEPFGSDGDGFVDSVSGIFKIGSSMTKQNVIQNIKSINVVNNYSTSITSNSNFSSAINDSDKQSWNITVKSKNIIKNDLVDYSKYFDFSSNATPGAQTVVEIAFNSSTLMDTIRLNPTHGKNFKILQAIIFTDDTELVDNSGSDHGDQYIAALDSPRLLDSIQDITFPRSLVSKIILILNEQGYVRNGAVPINSEVNSKLLQDFVQRRVYERVNSFSKIQDIVFFLFGRNYSIKGLKTRKNSEYDFYSYRFPSDADDYLNLIEDELFTVNNTEFEDRPIFHRSPVFADLIMSMSSHFDKSNDFIDSSIFVEGSNSRVISTLMPQRSSNLLYDPRNQGFSAPVKNTTSEEVIRILSTGENADAYEYSFGIKSIDFYVTNSDLYNTVDKACFVSSKINTPGQVVAIKSKVKVSNPDISGLSSVYDIEELLSYELSFTNKQNPIKESDWTPVLSYDQKEISSEVIFFDTNSLGAKLRFKAIPASITLFKNGAVDDSIVYSYDYVNKTLYLVKPSDLDLSAVWSVSYSPDFQNLDPYVIDVEKMSTLKSSTKRFRGPDGNGERFNKTDLNYKVKLSHAPYVDQHYRSYSSYSPAVGTKFSGPATGYSPVKVVLDDGTIAINMTNYSLTTAAAVFPNLSNLYFIQSGNSLVFNMPVNQGFYVDYEYSSNDTRFRLVVRKNVREDIPGGIDSVLIKAKVVNPDPYYDKIRTIDRI